MALKTRVTSAELVRETARQLDIPEGEAKRYLRALCTTLRAALNDGRVVELGDLFTLSVLGGPELREDESGGFSAYAAKQREINVNAVGRFKQDLDRSCQAGIYYVSRIESDFKGLLGDHFGRRGWRIVHTRSGMEALSRLDRFPPVACIFEHHADGWRELVRELKCNPATNWVPIVGIFPQTAKDQPVETLTVFPDDILYEPFDFLEFIRTAASGLAERVTRTDHDVVELHVQLPGSARDRKEACRMLAEVLFRADLPEEFCEQASAALAEALDNATRHGHRNVECCTIVTRMILDPRRLVLAVRDTGEGFDHAAALAAARRVKRKAGKKDPLAKAAAALKTRRRRDATQGGIARMLELVDRVDYNRKGNEVVLTKFRPETDESSTNFDD